MPFWRDDGFVQPRVSVPPLDVKLRPVGEHPYFDGPTPDPVVINDKPMDAPLVPRQKLNE